MCKINMCFHKSNVVCLIIFDDYYYFNGIKLVWNVINFLVRLITFGDF